MSDNDIIDIDGKHNQIVTRAADIDTVLRVESTEAHLLDQHF